MFDTAAAKTSSRQPVIFSYGPRSIQPIGVKAAGVTRVRKPQYLTCRGPRKRWTPAIITDTQSRLERWEGNNERGGPLNILSALTPMIQPERTFCESLCSRTCQNHPERSSASESVTCSWNSLPPQHVVIEAQSTNSFKIAAVSTRSGQVGLWPSESFSC